MPTARELATARRSSPSNEQGLSKLRDAARRLWLAKATVAELEERLDQSKKEVDRLSTSEVLEMFDTMGVDTLGVDANGNQPGFDATVKPFYEGGISSSWPEDRQEHAFELLEKFGHGGLIKNLVTVQVPRDKNSKKTIDKLLKFIDSLRLPSDLKKGVHPSTFKSWLKQEVESGRPMPPLDEIGAFIGRRVTIKERK